MKNWFTTLVKERVIQAVNGTNQDQDGFLEDKIKEFEYHVFNVRKIKENIELVLDTQANFLTASNYLSENLMVHFKYSLNKLSSNIQSNSDSNSTRPNPRSYIDVVNCYQSIHDDIYNVIFPSTRELILNRCLKPMNHILTQANNIYDLISKRRNILFNESVSKSLSSERKQRLDEEGNLEIIKLQAEIIQGKELLLL
jgi:hypothetical protein